MIKTIKSLLFFCSIFLFSSKLYCINSFSLSTPLNFCQYYNCSCPESNNEIKCKLDNSIKSVDFPFLSISTVDFSDSTSLEYLNFGDTGLNINKLVLRNINLREVHEEAFIKLPHLHYLDLSNNKIERFQELAFSNVNVLSYLNLSKSFKEDYAVTRELCELLSLEILDLSYLKLEEFTLVCWKTAHLKKLYLRYTTYVDKSWQFWFPYIGSQLELIDLSYSDIYNLEPSLETQSPNLNHLILSNCLDLQKSSLFDLLKQNNLISRLKTLVISKINASSSNFDLINLISSTNQTNLQHLDISSNNYNEDLNRFLFNQRQLTKLIKFYGSNNQFRICNQKLVAGVESSLLTSLECLDLSNNKLDSSCLFSIKPIKSLCYLDLSNNNLKLLSDDFKQSNFEEFLTDKTNLSYIDFSNNKFLTFSAFISPQHTKIDKFDISNNQLRSFHFISQTKYNHNKMIMKSKNSDTKIDDENDDINLNFNDDYEDDENDDDTEILIENQVRDTYDDDYRYVVIEQLNLSRNNFTDIFLNHMFQSIKNVVYLDLSLNPIQHTVGMNGEPMLVNKIVKNSSSSPVPSTTTKKLEDIDLREEAFCIDELDLSNCNMKRIPNLQHTCINKINLAYNHFSGSAHLILSKYSIFFLDYLNIQSNNISYLKILISEQIFKQDKFPLQNSPFHYFLGTPASIDSKPNKTHTFIDLKSNKNFKCDCNLYKLVNDLNYIKILSECYSSEFEKKCQLFLESQSNTNGITIKSLNQKLRVLFIVTCFILVILSLLIIYYMCSDCFKNLNFQPYDRFKYNFNRICGCVKLQRFFNIKNNISSTGSSSSSSQIGNNIGVHYTKLNNEIGSSQIEINA